MKIMTVKDKLWFAQEAQLIADQLGISLGKACEFVVFKNDLSIKPKTLANMISLQKSVPVNSFNIKKESACVNNESEIDDHIYDQELVLEELQKKNDQLQKKLLVAENRAQTILWAMEKVVKPLPKYIIPDPVKLNKYNGRTEIAMLDLSDIHLGKKMDPRDTAGICSYNHGIFTDQCMSLVKAVSEITEIQRLSGIKINKLIINSLGDLVDGEMIYGGQGAEVEYRTIDQIYKLGDYLLMKVLVPIIRLFPEVEIMSVDGNHGRVGHKREGYDRKLNFDFILMMHLRQRLSNFADRVKFNISQSSFMIYKLFDKFHYLSHGARAGNSRYPMSGMERQLTSASMLTRNVIDYVHLAHFHRGIKFDFNFSQILVNGSWLGPTEFSVGCMLAGDFPQQMFYGINSRHITWQYSIYLDKHFWSENKHIDESGETEISTPIVDNFDSIDLNQNDNNQEETLNAISKFVDQNKSENCFWKSIL